MFVSKYKKRKIIPLFKEFINLYLSTPDGINETELYKSITKNIFAELFTESSLVRENIKNFIAKTILLEYEDFIIRYDRKTNFVYYLISQIDPDNFIYIDSNFLNFINYVADTNYSLNIEDYQKLINLLNKVILELNSEISRFSKPALKNEHLFALFAYWLAKIKKYDFNKNNKISLEEIANILNYKIHNIQTIVTTLKRKKQIILQGSSGTGKTFIAENIAKYLIGGTDGFYDIIQFHPAYTYEDFIQGIRPQTNNGKLEYNLVPGRFLEFCRKAEACNDNCILIIDEINRANLASVFGELMYLLEYRYREIDLAGSREKFKIPNNVYIIGTMNTADRSIALVDFALRRRFAFIAVKPNYDVIRRFHKKNNQIQIESLITVLEDINQEINDSNYSLGISYFLIEDLSSEIENIWIMEIEPYLEEYFYNSLEQVDQFRWDEVKDKILG